jgi:hypothetical protein
MDYYLVAEYLLENIEMDIIYKVTYITIINTASSFKNELQIDIIQRSLSSNSLGIIKFVMLILFFLNILIKYYIFVNDIKKVNNDYEKWFRKINQTVTLQAKKTRDILLSEKLRHYFSRLTTSRILLNFILNFSILYLVIIAISIYWEWNLFSKYDEYSDFFKVKYNNTNIEKSNNEKLDLLYTIKNDISYLSYYRELSKKLVFPLIYLGSLRIILSFNLGVYFFHISTLFEKTIKKNIMIIFLIILILPTYVFYGYLLFGSTNINYKSVDESFFTNFIKIFSFEDDITFKEQTTSTIYIMGFTFTINLMIGNLFVSIINYTYLKLQRQLYFPSDKFSWIKVILFPCNRPKKLKKSFNKENILIEIDNFIRNKFINVFDPLLLNESVEDFSNKEMEKMRFINNGMYWLEFSTREMKNAIEFSNVEVSLMDNNKYNYLDKSFLTKNYYANINFKMELLNSIEKEILNIKEYYYKSNLYYSFINSKENSEEKKEIEFKNEKEFIKLENEIKQIISDIEELRELRKKIKRLDIDDDKSFDHEYNLFN